MSAPSRAGTLVLVVGPSGAGKDTLIAIARGLVADEPMIVFPRRVVTRDGSSAEDHDSITPGDFACAAERGAFAFWWEAHGLMYGVPAAIDDNLRRGATVLCNVSRLVVPLLRRRYVPCRVVLVDAPREVRAARIAARKRATDGDVLGRVDRIFTQQEPLRPDLKIENVNDPQEGGRALADLLLGLTTDSSRKTFSHPVCEKSANV